MHITDDKYFFYGSAKKQRFGDETKYLQYGLFLPVIGRFVLTHSNLEVLQMVSLLFSGKYTFTLCRLDQATNFNVELIDNTCCLNWTYSPQHLGYTRFYNPFSAPRHVEMLHNEHAAIDFLLENQQYLLMSASWVDFFIHSETKENYVPWLEYNFLNVPFNNDFTKFKEMVYKTIYHESNYSKAFVKISKLQKKYKFEEFNISIDRIS